MKRKYLSVFMIAVILFIVFQSGALALGSTSLLKYGSKGTAVKNLQSDLNSLAPPVVLGP